MLKKRRRDERHLHITAHDLGEIEQVKVEGIDGFELVWVSLDKLVDSLWFQVKINHLVHVHFDSH